MAFISEIHYQNTVATGTGTAEYVEVALTAVEFANRSQYTVATYQGTGTVAAQASLDTLSYTLDPTSGLYVFTFYAATTNPDTVPLGANEAEAIALVKTSGPGAGVISFYDIGVGTKNITATNGPASGAVSTNIAAVSGTAQSIQFKADGTRIDGSLTPGSAICYASGTLIATETGERLIEDIKAGDMVLTRDRGPQPVLWHGRTHYGFTALRANPKLRPVRIPAGALGHGLPRRDLVVSRQHRVLMRHPSLELFSESHEGLVAAIHLGRLGIGDAGFLPESGITYHHLLFARHEILFAEGQEAESFFPGAQALDALSAAQREEVELCLVRLPDDGTGLAEETVAPHLGWQEAKVLADQILPAP